MTHGVAAASAGAIATLATHPFDVIKVNNGYLLSCIIADINLFAYQTKVQVRKEERYHGFFRTISTVWKVRCLSELLNMYPYRD